MTDEMLARTMREIVEPTMRGMAAEGSPFSGNSSSPADDHRGWT